jgi:hypothetical protein
MLAGGLTVSLDSLQLLWSLEDRGCVIEAEQGDLLVGPRGRVTDAERERIRALKFELLALVRYCETVQ